MMDSSGNKAPHNLQSVPTDLAYKKGEGIGGRFTVLDVLGKGGLPSSGNGVTRCHATIARLR
jgi:hypothetical protein